MIKLVDKPGRQRHEPWDFSWVHSAEVEACLRYELAREVENPSNYFSNASDFPTLDLRGVRIDIEKFSRGRDRKGRNEIVLREVRKIRYRIEDFHSSTNSDPLLKEMFTGAYFEHPDGTFRAFPPYLASHGWINISAAWRAFLVLRLDSYQAGFTSLSFEEFQATPARPDQPIETLFKPRLVQAFISLVGWHNNDETLVEDFKKWLVKHRPKSIPSIKVLGRQSTHDSLNAVSAMRLRHQFVAEEAMEITKAALGKPLYTEKSSWDRAANRAIELFHQTFPGAGEPKSSVKKSARRGRPRKQPE